MVTSGVALLLVLAIAARTYGAAQAGAPLGTRVKTLLKAIEQPHLYPIAGAEAGDIGAAALAVPRL
jgi:hypothetical protein